MQQEHMLGVVETTASDPRTYQRWRLATGIVSIGYLLGAGTLFVGLGLSEALYRILGSDGLFMVAVIGLYLLISLPLDWWSGRWVEQRGGKALAPIGGWLGAWLQGSLLQGALFFVGGLLLLTLQRAFGVQWWLAAGIAYAVGYLLLVLAQPYLLYLAPIRLERETRPQVQQLARQLATRYGLPAPSIWRYTAADDNDWNGGWIGLGPTRRLLLSASAAEQLDEPTLRFVLSHEFGHLRGRHQWWSLLASIGWTALTLVVVAQVVDPLLLGSAAVLPPIAIGVSALMLLGLPVLSALARRMELAADQSYLEQGGNAAGLAAALRALAQQNHVVAEIRPGTEGIFHPLPSIATRVAAAHAQE